MGSMRPALVPLPGRGPADVVFGDPHVTPDGTTVIEVSRVRKRGDGGPDHVTAVGIYVIHEGNVTFSPAVDGDRIALIGVSTGFVAAFLATLAVLRRPPWPALTGTITVERR